MPDRDPVSTSDTAIDEAGRSPRAETGSHRRSTSHRTNAPAAVSQRGTSRQTTRGIASTTGSDHHHPAGEVVAVDERAEWIAALLRPQKPYTSGSSVSRKCLLDHTEHREATPGPSPGRRTSRAASWTTRDETRRAEGQTRRRAEHDDGRVRRDRQRMQRGRMVRELNSRRNRSTPGDTTTSQAYGNAMHLQRDRARRCTASAISEPARARIRPRAAADNAQMPSPAARRASGQYAHG